MTYMRLNTSAFGSFARSAGTADNRLLEPLQPRRDRAGYAPCQGKAAGGANVVGQRKDRHLGPLVA